MVSEMFSPNFLHLSTCCTLSVLCSIDSSGVSVVANDSCRLHQRPLNWHHLLLTVTRIKWEWVVLPSRKSLVESWVSSWFICDFWLQSHINLSGWRMMITKVTMTKFLVQHYYKMMCSCITSMVVLHNTTDCRCCIKIKLNKITFCWQTDFVHFGLFANF